MPLIFCLVDILTQFRPLFNRQQTSLGPRVEVLPECTFITPQQRRSYHAPPSLKFATIKGDVASIKRFARRSVTVHW